MFDFVEFSQNLILFLCWAQMYGTEHVITAKPKNKANKYKYEGNIHS